MTLRNELAKRKIDRMFKMRENKMNRAIEKEQQEQRDAIATALRKSRARKESQLALNAAVSYAEELCNLQFQLTRALIRVTELETELWLAKVPVRDV